MSYRVLILRRAQKEVGALPEATFEKVVASIRDLGEDPRPPGCRKLTGREGFRVRVGDYRVIYEIDDAGRYVTVLHVGHRKDVYR